MVESLPGSRTKIIDCNALPHEKPFHHDCFPNSFSDIFIMTGYEAHHIVQSLDTFPIEEIGSSKFMHMYAYQLERLSLQAHASAKIMGSNLGDSSGDEFVVESILNFEKIPTLVQTLLTVELWRINISSKEQQTSTIPKDDDTIEYIDSPVARDSSFLSFLATHGNSLRLSFTLHTETTLVCLLALVLFRRESCRDMDCDTAIALVDYCARQLVRV